ncbi:MAG: lipocalin family protein [Sphingobacteriales bacterium JAD_PAG50586_3]|nr:MAG: lipocalin family protein [Sphingobacteriales bacterium JAD_PAG50586_3]
MRLLALIFAFAASQFVHAQKPVVKPVGEINLDKFVGTWYLISRLPNPIDKNMSNVVINYTRKGDKKIKETLTSTNPKGKEKTIKSTLTYKGGGIIAGPLGGKYAVAILGDNYEYFAMATTNGKYLWINGRQKTIDNNTYNSIVSTAGKMGFDVLKLEKVTHNK